MRFRIPLFLTASITLLSIAVGLLTGPESLLSGAGMAEIGRAAWQHARLRDPATGRIPEAIRRRELSFASELPKRPAPFLGRAAQGSSMEWMHRGPFNIGGRTRALGIDATGEDTIIAGGVSGGLWRSSDRGMTWVKTTLPHQLPSVSCLVQDTRPGKSHIWYAGSGEIIGGSASAPGAYYLGDGVFKSEDNGRSWQSLVSTASNTPQTYDRPTDFIWSIVIDPTASDTDKVYIATAGSIHRSTDGGASWRTVLISSPQAFFCDLDVTSDGVFYATFSWQALSGGGAGRRGVYRSSDGARWTWIGPSFLPDSTRRIVGAIAPSDERVVYFIVETPHAGKAGRNFQGDSVWASLWKYTYDSGDGSGTGGRWQDLSDNLPSFGGSFGDFNPQFSYDLHVAVHPENSTIVLIGGTNLYRSTDGFATPDNVDWIGGYRNIPIDNKVIIPLSYPNHHPDQHSALFSKNNPSVVYTASDGGVHRTQDFLADSVSWESLNTGYLTSQFYTVAYAVTTAGHPFLLGGMQDNGTWSTASSDPTAPWIERGTGDGSFCAVADSARVLYVSKQNGKTYRVLLDADGSMTGFARIDPSQGKGYRFINPFVVGPNNSNVLFLLGGRYLWRNTDASAIPLGNTDSVPTNWSVVDSSSDGADLSAVAISASTPGYHVWYGTENGRVHRVDDAMSAQPTSRDMTGASFPRDAYVNCIAVDPSNADRVALVFSNYSVVSIFLTTDGGETWSPIAGNLEQNPNGSGNGPSCRWFSFVRQTGGTMYLVGTSTGLYSTTRLDGPDTMWEQEGPTSIGNVPVDMMAVSPDGYSIAVATHGFGVFTAALPTLDVEWTGREPMGGMYLGEPEPNPTRGSVVLRWRLQRATEKLRIGLYDVTGRRVLDIDRGVEPAGEGSARLPVTGTSWGLPSGRYYIRLESDDAMVSRELRIIQ